MDKKQLLELEQNAHLTLAELAQKAPQLAAPLRARLDARAQAAAVDLLGGSERLRTVARDAALGLGDAPDRTNLRAAAVAALRDRIRADRTLAADTELAKELEEIAKRRPDGTGAADPTVAAAVELDAPIGLHPEFTKELATARLYRLADAAGLSAAAGEVLAKEVGDVAALREDRLAALVQARALDEAQARAAGRAASLYHALDLRPELVQAVGGVQAGPKELVARDAKGWTQLVEAAKVTPPPGLTKEAYGELLERKMAALFPAQALAGRLAKVDAGAAVEAAAALEPLRQKNPGVDVLAARSLDALATDGLDPNALGRARAALEGVGRLVDRFPGMKLGEVLADAQRPAAQKVAEVTRRVAAVTSFLSDNPRALELDLTPGAAGLDELQFTAGTTPADRTGVLSTVRTWQRLRSLTDGDVAEAEALGQAGVHAALAMASAQPEAVSARSGLALERVRELGEKARAMSVGLTGHMGGVLDVLHGGFGALGFGNVSPAVAQWLKQLPGFDELFGAQARCNCTHCQSILSPAAYFVDLMKFVEDRVTTPAFAAQPGHPLKLQNRRPDLWTLDLTCENTNRALPYLQVIDEVLENAVARDAGYVGNVADRTAVEQRVYEQTLPDRVDGFAQPFHRPFAELATFLTHFSADLGDLGEAAQATGDELARLRLGLPPRDFALVTQPNVDLAFLRRVYGVAFAEAAGVVQPVDVQSLLGPMGVSRQELGELLAARFVTGGGAVPIRVVSEKRSPESVQNDVERVTGLTRAALDRLHRLVRAWRALGWRIGEVDLALDHLGLAGLGGLDAPGLRALAALQRLRARLDVSVEELLALCTPLPWRPVLAALPAPRLEDPVAYPPPPSPFANLLTSLFDRLFNPAGAPGPAWPQPAASFLHPSLAQVPPAAVDPALARLQAGTGADDAELYQLVLGLALPLGVDSAAAADAGRSFSLSLENLGLLVRHARLARALRVGIPELFALCALTPEIAFGHVATLADLEALLRFHSWWRASPWALADLVEVARPGLPAVITSRAAVNGAAAGQAVTCAVTAGGVARPAETVTFAAALPSLDAVVQAWNAQATRTAAYRSDARGAPAAAGAFLSLRSRDEGADVELSVTADPAGVFTAGPPRAARGTAVALALGAAAGPTPEEVAAGIATSAADSLSFADTLFATVPALAPVALSAAAVAGAAGGETVTFVAAPAGRPAAPETVVLAAAASLDAVVADWNAKAVGARAYRADAAGAAAAAGDRLALRGVGAAGSATALTVTADSAGLFGGGLPRTWRGAEITPAQSQAIVAANAASFEPAPIPGKLRLRAAFDPAAALVLPAGVAPAFAAGVAAAVAEHHSRQLLLARVPAAVSLPPARVALLVELLGVDLSAPEWFRELRGDVAPPARIAALVASLRRLGKVFAQESPFDASRLAFVRARAALFGIERFDRLTAISLRRLDGFRALLAPFAAGTERPPDLEACLVAFDPATRFAAAPIPELARTLGIDVPLLRSLLENVRLSATPFEALDELRRAAERIRPLGLSGTVLGLVTSAAYADLARASAAVQAAFRSRYPDEREWQTKVEPFRDALLARRRDGLVAYLLCSSPLPFDRPNDLYAYYLLDVQLDGCARTSRVAAAIDSVQLYVQRCLMNLEESPPGAANPVHVLPGSIPEAEWAWRRSYRLWEANRKIFLFPENWIEPELRDDKTPLFTAFENDLLSKEITEETILEAYGRYLRGFDELSHLAIAGSYHEKDDKAKQDVLHLFGVTADEPPVYYYRRVENAHYGVADAAKATRWGAWEKLEVQIPVRRVSPVVYQGQVYAFWVRYTTRSVNQVKEGESRFTGYQHRAFVEFTRRKLDGTWTAPQKIKLLQKPFDVRGDGVVLDPLVPKTSTTIPLPWFNFTLYTNFQPLYDEIAHEAPKDDYSLRGFMWDQVYAAAGDGISLRGCDFQLWSPLDLYRLEILPRIENYAGDRPEVPWLNPVVFLLLWLFSGGKFDLTRLLPRRLVWSRAAGGDRILHSADPGLPCFDTYSYATLLLDEARILHYAQPAHAQTTNPRWPKVITDYLRDRLVEHRIATVPAGIVLDVVNGSVGDLVLQTSGDAFYLQYGARTDGRYHLRRLGASVSADVADILYKKGLDQLLQTSTQLALAEHATKLQLVSTDVADATGTGALDFRGAMGTYLREVFFHVPFLIADYFNSQGKHEEAHRWYRYVFDPTSAEQLPAAPGLSPEEQRRRSLDRAWRYREFRGLGAESLRAQLTDAAAIEAYRRDPFNPHAIARTRISAYQKSIVMKVVDNLLDWGDDLFAKAFAGQNQEYLREATQKYVMAQDILGPRPAEVGDCGEGILRPKTYPAIEAARAGGSEFLQELETLVVVRDRIPIAEARRPLLVELSAERAAYASARVYGAAAGKVAAPAALELDGVAAPVMAKVREAAAAVLAAPSAERVRALRAAATPEVRAAALKQVGPGAVGPVSPAAAADELTAPALAIPLRKLERGAGFSFGWSFLRQVGPAFCVPGNDLLLSYWDRVEDRLRKLRHCMDIDGNVRQLPLFAPPIDPGLLARARAAGLSLEDVLAAAGGDLPPYRFAYLVEKAKAFAATVQGLGGALLGALEKRDAEELVRLRNVHQRNLLLMGRELRRGEVQSAVEAVDVADRRIEAAEYRRDYYAGLVSSGLSGAEVTQEAARITASVIKGAAGLVDTIAAIAHLLPDVGSPFAMKYGGLAIGQSATSWSQVALRFAEVAETTGTIAGIVAGYERREQGWEHQRALAKRDAELARKEKIVAELRLAMAQRGEEMHEKTLEQQDEVMELYDRKFSGLGLYTQLSRSLQQLHRQAYENALALARLAERAYRFERPGDDAAFVGGEWDGSRAGLHAGERLMLALQRMERRYLETNDRQAEVNQSFSLWQLDPAALVTLRESGRCEFSLPEWAFDLNYPGHYRRWIRAVRLTLPCITGPYTNVSAKLSLLGSQVRPEPGLGAAGLVEVPTGSTSSIATSTAQGDGGVFELSFRDERYMPFERAGAVSRWRLELPANFRPFDYQSITDVIMNLSYVAADDGALREQVESRNAAVQGSLAALFTARPLTRVISLRQEFSAAFHRLTESAVGTPVTFELTDRHFPLFLRGRNPVATAARVVLVLEERAPVGAVAFTLNGIAVGGFSAPTNPPTPADPYGGLPLKDAPGAFAAGLKRQHTIVVTDAGALAPAAAPGAPLLDVEKLRDVLIVVEHRI